MKRIKIFAIVILCFLFVFCAHRHGCVIEVKSIKQREQSHYLYDLNASGAQYQFNLYIDSRLCDENEKEKVLSEIFQEHASKNGFTKFELINVHQTKIMDNFEYGVAFK